MLDTVDVIRDIRRLFSNFTWSKFYFAPLVLIHYVLTVPFTIFVMEEVVLWDVEIHEARVPILLLKKF